MKNVQPAWTAIPYHGRPWTFLAPDREAAEKLARPLLGPTSGVVVIALQEEGHRARLRGGTWVH